MTYVGYHYWWNRKLVGLQGNEAYLLRGRKYFNVEFDALASKLAPLGPKLPIGAEGYADLAAECKRLDQAANVQRLIALTR